MAKITPLVVISTASPTAADITALEQERTHLVDMLRRMLLAARYLSQPDERRFQYIQTQIRKLDRTIDELKSRLQSPPSSDAELLARDAIAKVGLPRCMNLVEAWAGGVVIDVYPTRQRSDVAFRELAVVLDYLGADGADVKLEQRRQSLKFRNRGGWGAIYLRTPRDLDGGALSGFRPTRVDGAHLLTSWQVGYLRSRRVVIA